MLRRVPDSEAMTMTGKVLVAWRDEEENGMAVGVFDVPAGVNSGDDLDREVAALMAEWDTVAVVDRAPLPDRASAADEAPRGLRFVPESTTDARYTCWTLYSGDHVLKCVLTDASAPEDAAWINLGAKFRAERALFERLDAAQAAVT